MLLTVLHTPSIMYVLLPMLTSVRGRHQAALNANTYCDLIETTGLIFQARTDSQKSQGSQSIGSHCDI